MGATRRSSTVANRRETLAVEALEDRRMLSVSAAEQEFVYIVNVTRQDPAPFAFSNGLSSDTSKLDRNVEVATCGHPNRSTAPTIPMHEIVLTEDAATGPHRRPADVIPQDGPSTHSSLVAPFAETIAETRDPTQRTDQHHRGLNANKSGNGEIAVATARDASRMREWIVYSARQSPCNVFLTGGVLKDSKESPDRPREKGLSCVRSALSAFNVRTTTAGSWSAVVEPESRYVLSATAGLPATSGSSDTRTSIIIEFRAPHVDVQTSAHDRPIANPMRNKV